MHRFYQTLTFLERRYIGKPISIWNVDGSNTKKNCYEKNMCAIRAMKKGVAALSARKVGHEYRVEICKADCSTSLAEEIIAFRRIKVRACVYIRTHAIRYFVARYLSLAHYLSSVRPEIEKKTKEKSMQWNSRSSSESKRSAVEIGTESCDEGLPPRRRYLLDFYERFFRQTCHRAAAGPGSDIGTGGAGSTATRSGYQPLTCAPPRIIEYRYIFI